VAAEEQLFALTETQDAAYSNLKSNRFIIKDSVEPSLDEKIVHAGQKAGEFVEEIDAAKILFAEGEFIEVRLRFESNYDDEHQGPGLIELIGDEVPLVATVSTYATSLREKRDAALRGESGLLRELEFRDAGFVDKHLQNSLGTRLVVKEPTLNFIVDIAYRPDVSAKGKGMYESARSSFVSAASGFGASSFVHYIKDLDGTLDQTDYDSVLSSQRVIFGRIESGDSSLSSLVVYKGKLTTQWFTVVAKRWEDSHQEEYFVKEKNPDYREGTREDCTKKVCTPDYKTNTYCRKMATADGGVTQDCTKVREAIGTETCGPCPDVHWDNGEDKIIDVRKERTIAEYWVKVDTHDTNGVSSEKTDLKVRSTWMQTDKKLGYQEWKPFGDDRAYQGFGGIGPHNDKPYIMEKR